MTLACAPIARKSCSRSALRRYPGPNTASLAKKKWNKGCCKYPGRDGNELTIVSSFYYFDLILYLDNLVLLDRAQAEYARQKSERPSLLIRRAIPRKCGW